MIIPQWLELPMSRTNFHGPKDVRAIEVRLYPLKFDLLSYRENSLLTRNRIRISHGQMNYRCSSHRSFTVSASFYACSALSQKCNDLEAGCCVTITKTCLYYFDPLKPHFYIVKLGITGVYIIFLISAQNIDCGYS